MLAISGVREEGEAWRLARKEGEAEAPQHQLDWEGGGRANCRPPPKYTTLVILEKGEDAWEFTVVDACLPR